MEPDFRDLIGLLSKWNAEFLVVGAHALGAHGIVRATQDLDIWVNPTHENAKRVWNALAEFGAPMENTFEDDFVHPKRVVQVGIEPLRVDVMTSVTGVTFDQAWKNRIVVKIAGMNVPVIGREQLIQNKRASGRPKDLLDVQALESQGKH